MKIDSHPEAAEKPIGVFEPSDAIASQSKAPATVERLTWRLADVAKALGVSRRALERERSAGRLPKPDMTIGRMPLWQPKTIRRWIEGGGRP